MKLRLPGRGVKAGPQSPSKWYFLKYVFWALVALLILGVGWLTYQHFWGAKTSQTTGQPLNVYQRNINSLSKATDLESRRDLVINYVAASENDKAAKEMETIADKTRDPTDFVRLIDICAYKDVTIKSSCVADVKKNLANFNLDFRSYYTVAYSLEQCGDKKAAADYYSKALAEYPTKTDSYTMTKDQLSKHINELRQ
jgi:tetratricopeptide (TPR) repeat protein